MVKYPDSTPMNDHPYQYQPSLTSSNFTEVTINVTNKPNRHVYYKEKFCISSTEDLNWLLTNTSLWLHAIYQNYNH